MTYRIWVLLLAGKLEEAKMALANIPSGAGPRNFIRTLRYKTALLERKPDRALAALDGAPTWMPGAVLPYDIPASLLRAKALTLKGDKARALDACKDATTKLRARLRARTHSPTLWSALGLTQAMLGDQKKATQAGLRATQLLPISKDAFSGPDYLTVLAMIYARLNKPAPAVRLLRRLLTIPAGAAISVPSLRLAPIWDPIRHDPRFQALLRQYGQSTSMPRAAGTGS